MILEKTWAAVVLWIMMSGIAWAGPEEDKILAAFEFLCLEHINDPGGISALAPSMGLTAVPDDQKTQFLGKQTGRVWINLHKSERYTLVVTDEGSCNISAPYVDGGATLDLFLTNSRNALVDTQRLGSETESIYAITRPDRYGNADIHALVLADISNLKTIVGIQLTAVPETLARNRGMTIPEWP